MRFLWYPSGDPNLFEIIASIAIVGLFLWLTWPIWLPILGWVWNTLGSTLLFFLGMGVCWAIYETVSHTFKK